MHNNIVVAFAGGTCGLFLSNLLAKCLNQSDVPVSISEHGNGHDSSRFDVFSGNWKYKTLDLDQYNVPWQMSEFDDMEVVADRRIIIPLHIPDLEAIQAKWPDAQIVHIYHKGTIDDVKTIEFNFFMKAMVDSWEFKVPQDIWARKLAFINRDEILIDPSKTPLTINKKEFYHFLSLSGSQHGLLQNPSKPYQRKKEYPNVKHVYFRDIMQGNRTMYNELFEFLSLTPVNNVYDSIDEYSSRQPNLEKYLLSLA